MRDLEKVSKLSKSALLLLMLMESNDGNIPSVVDFVCSVGYVPRSYYHAKKELKDFIAAYGELEVNNGKKED